MLSSKLKNNVDTKPMTIIMSIKSNQDLNVWLDQRPQLNLSLLKQKNQSTLLHYAAYKNQIHKMKIYILHFQAFVKQHYRINKNQGTFNNQLKAWINAQNSDGLTALHFAAIHGNIQMIEFLQGHGANMLSVNKQKQNILFLAIQNNHLKTIVYLLEYRIGKVQFDLNAVNNKGQNILHKAAKLGYSGITAYLLCLGDQIEVSAKNNDGFTPLMLATSEGNKQIVKRMLLKGVDRHIINNKQQKAIDIAREKQKEDLIRILNDEYSNCDKLKIVCNLKVIYQVQKPSYKYSIWFIIFLNIVFIPTNLLTQVNLFGYKQIAYGIQLALYLSFYILFGLLIRKHPKKPSQNLIQIDGTMCCECRCKTKPNDFHCFICGVCVYRYDHHCPWINNCVSLLNIGKFIIFLLLVMIGSLQVLFLSMSVYFRPFSFIQPTNLIQIPQQIFDKVYLTNLIISGILSFATFILLCPLLADQIRNLFSNSTSFERAKNIKKKTGSLLTQKDSLDNLQSENQEQNSKSKNCCAMLSQEYET